MPPCFAISADVVSFIVISIGVSVCSGGTQVVANLRRQRDEVREAHRRLLQQHHERFHKVWGQLMKTGYQNSRFAHQVGF